MQHICELKGIFKYFVKFTSGISLGYFENILK